MTDITHQLVKTAKHFKMEPWLYSLIYRGFREISKKHGVHITTNNYGFYPTRINTYDRYQVQMYHEYVTLLKAEDIERALEIGSGAGGGLMYMQSRLSETHFSGFDRCKEAIRTCQYFLDKQQKSINLYTNINDIIKSGNKFDAIVSAETGISKKPSIFSIIHNLLNDRGVFVYYDNTSTNKLDRTTKFIESQGFKIEFFKDITENVLKACEHDSTRRLEIIEKYLPVYLRPFRSELRRYMCVKDSSRYINFSNGTKKSFLLKARKIKSVHAAS